MEKQCKSNYEIKKTISSREQQNNGSISIVFFFFVRISQLSSMMIEKKILEQKENENIQAILSI